MVTRFSRLRMNDPSRCYDKLKDGTGRLLYVILVLSFTRRREPSVSVSVVPQLESVLWVEFF